MAKGDKSDEAYREEMLRLEREQYPYRLRPTDPLFTSLIEDQLGPVGQVPYQGRPGSVVDPNIATHHPKLSESPSSMRHYGAYHTGGRKSFTHGGEVAPDADVPYTVYPEATEGVVSSVWSELRGNTYNANIEPDTLHTFGRGGSDTIYAHEYRHRLDPKLSEEEQRRHDLLNAKNARQYGDIDRINTEAFGKKKAAGLREDVMKTGTQNRLMKWEYQQGARVKAGQSLGEYMADRRPQLTIYHVR